MFCPVCKAEYREGFTLCPDCDTNLVTSLDSSKSFAAAERPLLAWRGNDPVAFSRVLAALRDAEIPTYQITENDQLTLQPIARPRYGIFIRMEDASRAGRIVREVVEAKPTE
jgi:hypothetical protein